LPERTDHWSADRYEANARFVSDLGAGVLDWLAPQPGELILDLGCGDGALTEKLIAAEAEVIGTDFSADMVAGARARGIDARVMDGHALDFERQFDAVFSNAALHWMTDPDAVIAGVARALKPGGRFVAEFGGHGNVAAIRVALSSVIERLTGQVNAPGNIWYFPGCAEHGARLEAAGFTVDRIALIPRPTPIPSDMAGWLETLAAPVLNSVPEALRAQVRDEAATLLRPALCDTSGNWTADYIRIRFEARLA
jgi:SAM-dependent methyltransferase